MEVYERIIEDNGRKYRFIISESRRWVKGYVKVSEKIFPFFGFGDTLITKPKKFYAKSKCAEEDHFDASVGIAVCHFKLINKIEQRHKKSNKISWKRLKAFCNGGDKTQLRYLCQNCKQQINFYQYDKHLSKCKKPEKKPSKKD